MDLHLVEIWKQLNDEMCHRDTMFMQVIVCIFLFLGAFSAIMHYSPELKWWIWILGFVGLIVACIYAMMVGKGQKRCYEAALEIQRNFTLPEGVDKKLKQLMDERKPRISSLQAQIPLSVLLLAFWIYMGLVEVFGCF